ncbi:adenylate/guanylate cyclase domain-containing protein [Roseivirga sp. BDSF3-8]|uniref:adenylate/guanylate cyclase domain-containing protein n=1 Tax=Roseivirga sp. BDSF3-8 TaxID=3241598 RepID=UPI003531EC86
MIRRFFYGWLAMASAWIICTCLYVLIIVQAVKLFMDLASIDSQELGIRFDIFLTTESLIMQAALFGLFFGTLFFFINIFFDRSIINKQAFGRILLIKSLLYFVALVLVTLFVSTLMKSVGYYPQYITLVASTESLLQYFFLGVAPFFTILILLMNLLMLVTRKFGIGLLLSLFTGKYHQPISEERIFMFIDLRSSTTYAEQLGHIRYSKLIQDCFFVLNEIVDKYHGTIYQYVGDEAVVTWPVKHGLRKARCLEMFFAYVNKIKSRSPKYLDRFGLVPEFKAGAHIGTVTAAEVGDIKREIAYHGDTLNTAARVQSLCNSYQSELLVTKDLLERIVLPKELKARPMGKTELKGKLNMVEIYALYQSDKPGQIIEQSQPKIYRPDEV